MYVQKHYYVLLGFDRIDHYEQRLKALYYKKKLNERMSDVKNKVEGACWHWEDCEEKNVLIVWLIVTLIFC